MVWTSDPSHHPGNNPTREYVRGHDERRAVEDVNHDLHIGGSNGRHRSRPGARRGRSGQRRRARRRASAGRLSAPSRWSKAIQHDGDADRRRPESGHGSAKLDRRPSQGELVRGSIRVARGDESSELCSSVLARSRGHPPSTSNGCASKAPDGSLNSVETVSTRSRSRADFTVPK